MSLRTRERVLPLNSTDFECDQGKPYITFKIAPDENKVIDLSTVEMSCFIDTNAKISFAGFLNDMGTIAEFAPRLQSAQYSFHYPLGLSGFLGRVRLLTGSGELLEEVLNLNILCETRKVLLNKDEADMQARMEGRGIQTNMSAFIQSTSQQGITGAGNRADGNSVFVSQLLQARFRFASIGGVFAKKLMTLSSGLIIEVYQAPYTNQRRLTGTFCEVESLKNMSIPCIASATAGEVILNQKFTTQQAVYNMLNILAGTKVMFSYTVANVYYERTAYIKAASAFANNLITLQISPNTNIANAVDLNPSLIGATDIYMSIVDGKNKLPQINVANAAYDATGAGGVNLRNDLFSHGVAVQTLPQNGSATATLYQSKNTISQVLPVNGGYDLFGVERSSYQHLPLYSGRLVKLSTQAGAYNQSEYTVRRINSMSVAGGNNQTISIIMDSDFAFAGVPAAVGNDPVGIITLLDEGADLLVENAPYLRQVQLEYETMPTTKPNPTATLPFQTWRCEQFNILKDAANPFLTLSTQCENLKYVILTSKTSYGLNILQGFKSILPLYNGRALVDLPIDVSQSIGMVPIQQAWMMDRSMGLPICQPNLLTEGGLSFDPVMAPVYPDKSLTATPTVKSFVELYSSNFVVLPGDSLNLIAGRYQIQLNGVAEANTTIYVFVKCERTLNIDKGKISTY